MKLDLIVWTSGFDASPVYFAFGHQGWSTSNNKECYYAMQDANWNGYRKIHCPFDCSKATVDETKKD